MKTNCLRTTILSHSPLILLSLLLLLPLTPAQSTNDTIPSNAVTFECTPLRIFALRLGIVQNCAAAILSLPQTPRPVSFHHAGDDDLGRLPVTTTRGDCMVTVDLVDSTEFGSWTSIDLVATLLMTACTDISLNRAYTGGYASAGNGGGIKVTLQRFEEGVGVGNRSGSGLLDE
ncbi:MAG: hypothetical protein ALECFALPRED_005582 [Alectoria fallacina]|uniref:Uncharacterized protein n=1 Tax=Alectoria fallacina TaxID=1903189 RepID=A0A8H3FYN0_9LECA|nr:MAG: hypothetical protein ALECFALPRED_005582 [Alectoria fallacina]